MTNIPSNSAKPNGPTARAPQGKKSSDVKALIAAVSFAATVGGWVLLSATAPADAQAAQPASSAAAQPSNQPASTNPDTQSPSVQTNPSRSQPGSVFTNPQTQTRRPAPVTRSRSSR